MSVPDVAERFLEALRAGDVDAARACCHEDLAVWHNYDGKTQTLDENMALLGWMTKRCRERRYDVRRLEAIEGGYLQQHTLELVLDDGRSGSAEALAIVSVRDGRIARIEEYIDGGAIGALLQG